MILLTFPLLPFHLSLSLSLYRYQLSIIISLLHYIFLNLLSFPLFMSLLYVREFLFQKSSIAFHITLRYIYVSISLISHLSFYIACIHCIAFRFPYSSSVCNASFQLIAPMFRFIYQRFKFPNTSLR